MGSCQHWFGVFVSVVTRVLQDITLPIYVKNYWKSCTTCSHTEPMHHKPYGLLKQLLIPEKPWNSISMDFIEKPPYSGYTSILSHCWPSLKAVTLHSDSWYHHVTSTCQLFILHVFSKHSFPSHVNSNHSTEFVSHFFWSLRTALEMKLHFIPDIIPEGDGLTKWTNQTLEQYLQVYCNYQQDNWSELLPLAEFTYKQYSECHYQHYTLLSQQGLSFEHHHSSRVWPCIHARLWLCHRPQWATPTIR